MSIQNVVRKARSLNREEAQRVLLQVLEVLYVRTYDGEWDGNNEWDSDTLPRIAEVLDNHGLVPVEHKAKK